MTENAWNACAVCGEQVTTKTRMHGFTGWEDAEGEVVGREVVATRGERAVRYPSRPPALKCPLKLC
jgi:hypothetical protein